MSTTSKPGWQWWAGLGGLLLLVVFPWLLNAVPLEIQLQYYYVMPFLGCISFAGLAYTACFLSVLVHEAGHWFFGALVGIGISHFSVGEGRSRLTFTRWGIQFSIGPGMYRGFVVEIQERENLGFPQQLVFSSGGMLAQLMLLVLCVWLLVTFPLGNLTAVQSLLLFLIATCGCGIFYGLSPHMVNVNGSATPNDALRIVRAWKNRSRLGEVWQAIEWRNPIPFVRRVAMLRRCP